VIVREEAVLCGAPWFEGVMLAVDQDIEIDWKYAEGDLMAADSVVCTIEGSPRSLLTAERAALNFLQLLSGVASATRKYVDVVAGTRAHPRHPQDPAGPAPGAEVRGARGRRRQPAHGAVRRHPDQGKPHRGGRRRHAGAACRGAECGRAGADRGRVHRRAGGSAGGRRKSVLLDNFDLDMMREAVRSMRAARCWKPRAASTWRPVRAIAETGVDRISIGSLTKDVRATDYSLRIVG
jgi:nicotinate-nucleotide pyrophosphorylase (carboxylating)